MKNASMLGKLKKAHDAHAKARQEVIALSGAAQRAAKRAIFAVQRGDAAGGEELLRESAVILSDVRKAAAKDARLAHEGSFRAALEEYAEAVFFSQLVLKGAVSAIPSLDEETQIAGLSDAVGECVRRMTTLSTEGRFDDARRLKKALEPVMEGLSDMDYSGYLRAKYDQAVKHFRRAEEILYDLAMRS